jgi:hypothetical protein
MGRLASALVWTALALVSVLALVPAALPHVLPWLAQRYGVEVAIGRASYVLPGPDLRMESVRVGGADGPLELRDLRVGLDLAALGQGWVRLARLTLEGGRLVLEPGPQGPRLRLGPELTVTPAAIEDLELAELTVRYAEGDLPPLRLGSARLRRAPPGDAGPRWDLRAEGVIGAGTFQVGGELRETGDGLEGEGQVSLRRVDLAGLRPLAGPALAAVQAGSAGGELTGRVTRGPDGLWTVEAEGRLEVDDLALVGAALEVAGARGRWEGRGAVALSAGAASVTGSSGRLDLDRARLRLRAPGGQAALLVRGLRLEGQASGPQAAGSWSLDGDGQAGEVAVQDGPWAGLTLTDVSLWGLWQRDGGELSVGQLRVARAERAPGGGVPPGAAGPGASGRVEALAAEGLSWGEEGLTVDRLATGPGALVWDPEVGAIALAGLAATEVVATPAWSRVGGLDLTGLSVPGPGAERRLEVARLTALGLHASGGEPVRLGELRVSGARLALARDPDGGWHLPAPLGRGEAGFTLDSVIVGQDSQVRFADLAADPAVRVALDGLEARLSAWDRDHPGRFSVRATAGDGGSLELSGELGRWPSLAPGPLQARFFGVPLAVFGGYAADWLGADPVAGRLDGELELRTGAGPVQGRLRLGLTDAQLTPRASAAERAGPLLRALRLLEDGRGRSELVLALGALAPLGEQVPGALRAAAARTGVGLGLGEPELGRLLADGAVPLRALHPAGDPPSLPPAETAFVEALTVALRHRPGLLVRLCPAPAGAAPPAESPESGPGAAVPLGAVQALLVAAGGLDRERVLTCPGHGPDSVVGGAVDLGLSVRP